MVDPSDLRRRKRGKKNASMGIAIKTALGQEIPVSVDKKRGFVSLFMNAQRRKLFHYLCNYPGSNMRMVSRDMGVGLPSARWHLIHLVEMGVVESRSIGKFKIFFPTRFINSDYLNVYALLNNDKGRLIFNIILENGGVCHSDLARELGISSQNLGGWMKKFEELEIVAKVRDGRNNRYYPTIIVSEMESMEREQRNAFKRHILNKLNADGVNPKILESTGNRYLLELTVGKNKYLLKLNLTPLKTILDGRSAFQRDFPKDKDQPKTKPQQKIGIKTLGFHARKFRIMSEDDQTDESE